MGISPILECDVYKIEIMLINKKEAKKAVEGMTDKEGKYEIEVEEGKYNIIVFKEGYKEQV